MTLERASSKLQWRMDPLSSGICDWLQKRRRDPNIRWPYHPRSSDLADAVREIFFREILTESVALRRDAAAGAIACDLGLKISNQLGQSKKMDAVLGKPEVRLEPAPDPTNPLRKARLGRILLSLETKACMTAHGKARPRLVAELISSSQVVRGAAPDAICVAMVIVNCALSFTSPLNQPGPNKHSQPRDAAGVIEELIARVHVGTEAGQFDGLAIALVDFDNDNRIEAVDSDGWVPAAYRYSNVLSAVRRRYERLS